MPAAVSIAGPSSAPNGVMRQRYGEMRAALATERRPAWRAPRQDRSTCNGLLATPAALVSLDGLRCGLSLNDGRASVLPRSPKLAGGCAAEELQRPATVLVRRPASDAARRIQRSAAMRAEQQRARAAANLTGGDVSASATPRVIPRSGCPLSAAEPKPKPEPETVHVFSAGAVRVPAGQEKDGRLTPEPRFRAFSPLFPSESFVFKQPSMAPHNDGHRHSPALLTGYWAKPTPPQNRPGTSMPDSPGVARLKSRRQRQDEATILMELVKLRLRYCLRDDVSWREIFNKFDTHRSGSVDYAQFCQVIRKGAGLTQDKLSNKDLRLVFQQIDLAASGVISYEDFDSFVSSENPYFELHVESLKQRLRASAPSLQDFASIFVYYDKDKNGLLDLRELRALIRREARVTEDQLSDIDVEKLFCLVDFERDGQISVDEFMSFLGTTSARFVNMVAAAKKKMLTAAPHGTDWHKIFADADVEKSGCLNLPEMLMAVRTGGNVTEKVLSNFEVEALFYSIDNDGNQAVTITELISFLNAKDAQSKGLRHTNSLSCCKQVVKSAKPAAGFTPLAVPATLNFANLSVQKKVTYGRKPKGDTKVSKTETKLTFKRIGRAVMATNLIRAFDFDADYVLRSMRKARKLCDMGETKQAVRLIDAVLDTNPNIPSQQKSQIYVMKSICAARGGDPWTALRLAEHAVQQDPKSVRAQQRQSCAQLALGRPVSAVSGIWSGLQREPDNERLIHAFESAWRSIKVDRAYWSVERDRWRFYPPAVHDGKIQSTTAKKALERVPLDEEWKHLDIQDIMHEQSLLRQAILAAIEDGEVNKKELELIMRCLRRVRIAAETQELVRKALADGDMDDDDRTLLMSICPPAPSDDWNAMLDVLQEEQGYLKMVFRMYCMEGAEGKSDGSSMTLIQFGKFAQASKVLAKGIVDLATCDMIFLRANQDRSEGLEKLLAKPKQRKQMRAVQNKDTELVVHEFAAAVIRLAHARYRQFPSIEERLKILIRDNIKTYALVGAIDASFSVRLEEPEPAMILKECRPQLKKIFATFSASGTTIGQTDASGTMSMVEWIDLCERCQLITPAFTLREARQMFVQVNLDDEIYVQEDDANNADELVFDEFEECLCRAALEHYPEDDAHPLSECLRSFFEIFVPVAIDACKRKNVKV